MPNFNWIKDYVGSLYVVPYGRYRGDCPVCNRINTFSVTDTGFERLWNCFHADCNTGGSTGVQLTKENSKVAFKEQIEKEEKKETSEFVLPDTFVSLSRSINAENYVKEVNSYDAYLSGLADIRYDYQQDRVVFLVKDGNKVVDAAGRSIDAIGPKWYRYSSIKHPFICGSGATAILLEDCASACSVSESTVGVALMGTNLLTEHIDVLKQYDRVFIALDKDATDKAIGMVRTLHTHVPTRLMVLRTDLKNMQRDERDDFIRSYIDR